MQKHQGGFSSYNLFTLRLRMQHLLAAKGSCIRNVFSNKMNELKSTRN